jgi:SpoVK/Ycf46/Vps4 family AAA+-type ATPase
MLPSSSVEKNEKEIIKTINISEFKNDEMENESTSQVKSNPQSILIDEYEKNPTQEFESLGYTIANIIKNTQPRFTIGIYGEWGTGKTTLMKSIEASLNGGTNKMQNTLCVWFNAWRYEREEHLATVALLKTIAFAMQDHERFDKIAKIIFRGLTVLGKDVKQKMLLDALDRKSGVIEEIDRSELFFNDLEKRSIYFEGINEIRKEMQKIRQIENSKDFRVVVFIDDLDRCSSKKALEVLESIKVFLDIEGFVYVVGLSHKTVIKLITQAYSQTGVKGEDYIKKIIQIPIRIPKWTPDAIVDLMETKLLPQLNGDYAKFLRQNARIISRVVDENPRQLKRFINNVIIAFETFASKQKADTWIVDEIFLAQIVKSEWAEFYAEFSREKRFRELMRMILDSREEELKKFFTYIELPKDEDPFIQKLERLKMLSKFMQKARALVTKRQLEIISEFDYEVWNFFTEFQDILFNIEKWKEIDHITEIVEEIPYDLNFSNKQNQENNS